MGIKTKKVITRKRGKNCHSWRGGKPLWYHQQARKVMSEYLGRDLKEEEIVHHNDYDITNNKIENLRLFSSHSKHAKYHWKDKKYAKKVSLAVSKAKKGCKLTDKHKENISKGNTGKVIPLNIRKKISKSNKDKVLLEESINKRTETRTKDGKPYISNNALKLMAESRKGHIVTAKTKDKISKSMEKVWRLRKEIGG